MAYFAQLLTQKALTLRLPKRSTDDIQRLVQMHQSTSVERAPFRRQLDFWAFSIATALAEDLEPLEGPSNKWGDKFVDTRAVDMPESLCDILAVAAFHHLGSDHEGIDDPAQIIEVGNCLAGSGCPVVLEQLNSRDLRLNPLDNVLNFAAHLYNHARRARS
ncbi:MAG: hypothetical protein OXH61_12055 [Acidimicrobiaceae bacterium]|nr:hypothetical protein [Acidimicrobiaceae bacterium]